MMVEDWDHPCRKTSTTWWWEKWKAVVVGSVRGPGGEWLLVDVRGGGSPILTPFGSTPCEVLGPPPSPGPVLA